MENCRVLQEKQNQDIGAIMKFEEENCIELPKYQNTFVYFLLKDNEVIYVGQTVSGIVRPLMQRDKDYDTIKIKYCSKEDLDIMENDFIMKYRPKYNKIHNVLAMYSFFKARDVIRQQTWNEKFNVRDLKKIIKKLEIETTNRIGEIKENNKLIRIEDFNKILAYCKENKIKI